MMMGAYEAWNHVSPAPNSIDLMLFQSLTSEAATPSEALRTMSSLVPYPVSVAFVPVLKMYEGIEEKLGLR